MGRLFAASSTLRAVAVVQRGVRTPPVQMMAEHGFGALRLVSMFSVSMSGEKSCSNHMSDHALHACVTARTACTPTNFCCTQGVASPSRPMCLPAQSPLACRRLCPPRRCMHRPLHQRRQQPCLDCGHGGRPGSRNCSGSGERGRALRGSVGTIRAKTSPAKTSPVQQQTPHKNPPAMQPTKTCHLRWRCKRVSKGVPPAPNRRRALPSRPARAERPGRRWMPVPRSTCSRR